MDKIGAKCNLAEAYFQLGLTNQKMAKPDESQMNFNQAIQLFTEIKAPKQVEKIFTCATQRRSLIDLKSNPPSNFRISQGFL